MKKKLFYFILFYFIFNPGIELKLFGQNVFYEVPGGGTNAMPNAPLNPLTKVKSSRAQYLIRASELTGVSMPGGNILSIGFIWAIAPNLNRVDDVTIRMAHTTCVDIECNNGISTFEDVSGFQTVYQGSITGITADNWIHVTFPTPFLWNGNDNLLIEICKPAGPAGSTDGSIYIQPVFLPPNPSYPHVRKEAKDGGCSITTASPPASNQRVKMRFEMEGACSIPDVPTINVVAPTCSANGTATITNHDDDYTYDFELSGPTVDENGNISGMNIGDSYTVTATHNGCTSDPSSSFTILGMLPTPTVSASTTNPTTCGGNGTIELTFTNVSDGDYTINYDGGSFTNVTVSGGTATVNAPAGTYSNLIITNSEGCTSATGESVTLEDSDAPDTPIINVVAATCSANGTASISNHIPGATYTFNPVGPSVDASGNIGGGISYGTAYTVTVTHNGCTSNSSASFTIEEMQSASSLDVTATNNEVCLGEPTVLTASGGVSYSWNTGSTDESITVHPTATTTYTVTGTDVNGCESTAQITITVNPLPVVEAGNDIELCIADDIVLTAYNPDGATITWDNGASDGVPFTQTENTVTYTVTAELNGCTSTDQVTVSISASLSDVEIASYYEVCLGEKAQIIVNNPKVNYTYSWYHEGVLVHTGSTLIIDKTSKDNAGQYTLLVDGQNGCFGAFEITVEVKDCGIIIPEVFTPNGDGDNDYFYIGNLEAYPKSELWIYNRWGIEVYHAENYLNNWDGTSQSSLNMGGNELPEGTYYYILRLGIPAGEYLLGAGKKYNGYVYLKR